MRGKIFIICLAILLIFSISAFAGGTKEVDLKKVSPGSVKDFFSGTCGDCHSATPKYPILGAKAGYQYSGHKNNGNSYYSNGDGCQKCHTNEGFIEYAATGQVDAKKFVAYPSQQGCFSCHDPHVTGDISLRTVKAVVLASGKTFDLGKGNLCANCHQVIGKAASTVVAMPAKKVMPFWGAHHGPQADMIAGTGAYEYPGKTYSNSMHSTVVTDSCVTCHMGLPSGRYGMSPAVGGHSFNIEGDVHEAPLLNRTGCLTCHKDIKQAKDTPVFDKTVADYDNDGKVEPAQLEVEGLLSALVNKTGTGALQTLNPPFFKADGSFNFGASGVDRDRTVIEMAALYNYNMIKEDRSGGVHNMKYAVQILYDTIQTLDPKFDVSKRPN